ncbi:MAG: hypothetical protein V1715_10835 [bacterium]
MLMLDKFSPPARAFWNKIPSDIQERLLDNACCAHCAAMTTITDYTGTIEKGDLILDGICIRCGNAVTRLIEGA